jgi:hypothetical protein
MYTCIESGRKMYHLTYMYCWLGVITTLMHTHRE